MQNQVRTSDQYGRLDALAVPTPGGTDSGLTCRRCGMSRRVRTPSRPGARRTGGVACSFLGSPRHAASIRPPARAASSPGASCRAPNMAVHLGDDAAVGEHGERRDAREVSLAALDRTPASPVAQPLPSQGKERVLQFLRYCHDADYTPSATNGASVRVDRKHRLFLIRRPSPKPSRSCRERSREALFSAHSLNTGSRKATAESCSRTRSRRRRSRRSCSGRP